MKDRQYDKEYASFHSLPREKKRRAQRNAARRRMLEAGKVRKGQDVHHKDRDTSNNSLSNLQAMSASANRSKK